MREWWRRYVEAPLDRLPVDWDTLFTVSWLLIAALTVLRGGY